MIDEVEEYKDYPEGSGEKRLYDKYHMSFEAWINKYYHDADLTGWEAFSRWATEAFAKSELFERVWCKERTEPYDYDILYETYQSVSSLGFFDEEFNRFIAFLSSEGFFKAYNLTPEEWIHSKNWQQPSEKCEIHCYSMVDVSRLPFGMNYIKSQIPGFYFWRFY